MGYCNICGVPEDKWSGDRICRQCESYCEVRNQDIVDERVFRFAERNGFLYAGRLNWCYLSECVEAKRPFIRLPHYMKKTLDTHQAAVENQEG